MRLENVHFKCPACGRGVFVEQDGMLILHDLPTCERWLQVETLDDATALLREANNKANS